MLTDGCLFSSCGTALSFTSASYSAAAAGVFPKSPPWAPQAQNQQSPSICECCAQTQACAKRPTWPCQPAPAPALLSQLYTVVFAGVNASASLCCQPVVGSGGESGPRVPGHCLSREPATREACTSPSHCRKRHLHGVRWIACFHVVSNCRGQKEGAASLHLLWPPA